MMEMISWPRRPDRSQRENSVPIPSMAGVHVDGAIRGVLPLAVNLIQPSKGFIFEPNIKANRTPSTPTLFVASQGNDP